MRASGYERAANDWYCEPAWIVEALLDVETFDGMTWDPACGGGTIPKTFAARGLESDGSDIVNRGYGRVADFFETTGSPPNIASNPPYGVIERFIDHALALTTGKVAILARLALLESVRRREFFARTPLARVWVSSRRVSMPPGGSGVKAAGGTIAFAWFVWDHAHSGPPTLGWLP